MNSIRARLSLVLIISLVVILGAGASGVYFFTRAMLLSDFDALLHSAVSEIISSARLHVMSSQLERQEREAEPGPFRLEMKQEGRFYAEAWTPEGFVLGRSPSLEGADLKFPASGLGQGKRAVTLPNGNPGRAEVLSPALFSPEDSERALKERLERLSRGRPGTVTQEVIGRERADLEQHWKNMPKSLILMVAMDRSDLDGTLRRLALVLCSVGLLMLLLTTLAVTAISHHGLAPLQQVADQASRVDASNLNFRFATRKMPAELKSICERLNDLLSRLQAAFARERCFSADVAHELRTPIAELRSLSEVALKWPNGDGAATNSFQDTLDIAVQMQGIVDGLLAIARCENGTQISIREPVRLAEVIQRSWKPFRERAAEKDLQVQLELPEPEVQPVESDPAMLGLILSNLFSNAVEYTPAHGALSIRLQSDGSDFDLSVMNMSDNVTADDVPHFFERFWRKDAARSSSQHSGIGLSVSHAFARALGLNLSAKLSENRLVQMTVANSK